jgi:hypothetical protein
MNKQTKQLNKAQWFIYFLRKILFGDFAGTGVALIQIRHPTRNSGVKSSMYYIGSD